MFSPFRHLAFIILAISFLLLFAFSHGQSALGTITLITIVYYIYVTANFISVIVSHTLCHNLIRYHCALDISSHLCNQTIAGLNFPPLPSGRRWDT